MNECIDICVRVWIEQKEWCALVSFFDECSRLFLGCTWYSGDLLLRLLLRLPAVVACYATLPEAFQQNRIRRCRELQWNVKVFTRNESLNMHTWTKAWTTEWTSVSCSGLVQLFFLQQRKKNWTWNQNGTLILMKGGFIVKLLYHTALVWCMCTQLIKRKSAVEEPDNNLSTPLDDMYLFILSGSKARLVDWFVMLNYYIKQYLNK